MITQDKNPNWNIFGGAGQNIPAAVDVVTNTERLQNTVGPASLNDGLASTTSPVQLIITPSGTASVPTRGIIKIVGTDHAGTVIDEEVAFTPDNINMPATSAFWYSTVTSITSRGFDSAVGKTYGISAQDSSAEVLFSPQDDELVVFWTVELTKGIVPNVFYGLCMQELTMSISRDALVSFECDFLGRTANLYTNLAGDTGSTARRSSSAALQKASPDIFAGWQAQFTGENDNVSIALQDATLSINQNLEYTNVLGDQFQPTPPARGDKRLVQTEATVVFSPENDFSDYFQNNRVIPNVKLTFEQKGRGAYPYKFELEMEQCQLTADPDPSVSDRGAIPQTVTMKAVRSPREQTEYQFRGRYSKYDRVRVYA